MKRKGVKRIVRKALPLSLAAFLAVGGIGSSAVVVHAAEDPVNVPSVSIEDAEADTFEGTGLSDGENTPLPEEGEAKEEEVLAQEEEQLEEELLPGTEEEDFGEEELPMPEAELTQEEEVPAPEEEVPADEACETVEEDGQSFSEEAVNAKTGTKIQLDGPTISKGFYGWLYLAYPDNFEQSGVYHYFYPDDITELNIKGDSTSTVQAESYAYSNLTDLDGIENLKNLESLTIMNAKFLTEVDLVKASGDPRCPKLCVVTIESCPEMNKVRLNRATDLKSIELRALPKLNTLSITGTTALEELRASDCGTSATVQLYLGENGLLETLDLERCGFDEIKASAFPSLSYLYLDDCGNTPVTFGTANTKLAVVTISKSTLSSIDFSPLTNLETLSVRESRNLESLILDNNDKLDYLNVDHCTNLRNLACIKTKAERSGCVDKHEAEKAEPEFQRLSDLSGRNE